MKKAVGVCAGAAIGLAITAWAALGFWGGWKEAALPSDVGNTAYTGSGACIACHADRHDSWYATFHRTMTQEASETSVLGRFDGSPLEHQGIRMRPLHENGRYYFEYARSDDDAVLQRIEVARTVGSRRYQQYLTKLEDGGTYARLHYLWHVEDQRWVHMNAAFLHPDDIPYDSHVSVWNQNCIFCHNTGPRPGIANYGELKSRAERGESVDSTREARFESEVAELGIACEACHGPGADHVKRAESAWTRLAMRLAPGRDPSISNPERMPPSLASQVCGQCHAQRVPHDQEMLVRWMREGPSFRPGLELSEHATPITRDTRVPVAGNEDMFALRFWADGTPRLSAYEFQGLEMSACMDSQDLSCMDCHTLHSGDPRGQISDQNRGNAPCLRCHEEFSGDASLQAHTKHAPESSGSVCYDCHMPKIVYGVMEIHRSHRIEVPDPTSGAAGGRPNACLNCHQDKSAGWAVEHFRRSGRAGTSSISAQGATPGLADLSVVLSGDPVQKAVAAWHAGQPTSSMRGQHRGWMMPYLMEALRDIYPSTRRFAQRSALEIAEDWPDARLQPLRDALQEFDFSASAESREAALMQIEARWRAIDKKDWPSPPPGSGVDREFRLPRELAESLILLGRSADKQISIGE